jgi:carboxyl-terminal processing protease
LAARRRSFFIAPAIIFACSMLGGMYGPTIMGASAATSEDDVNKALKHLRRCSRVVEDNFADKVTPDKTIYKGSIPGMTRTLDPHTSFFDPKDFQLLREDQKGHYYGVGMTVAPRNGKTIVIAPFAGSPAYKAGIRPVTRSSKSMTSAPTT